MKKFFCTLFALTTLVFAFHNQASAQGPQTPEEIVARMENVMESSKTQGLIMTMDMKIPIVGAIHTRSRMLGDKTRLEAEMMGKKMITYYDATTKWTYEAENQTLTIENMDVTKKDDNDNAGMLKDVTDGYDVTIKKETADAWYFLCKKSRDNHDKDAPKTMDLVVAKGSFRPVSMSAKLKGVTLSMYDFDFGVTEEEVTYRPELFPNAKVEDKR